jgi:hypothetical protein
VLFIFESPVCDSFKNLSASELPMRPPYFDLYSARALAIDVSFIAEPGSKSPSFFTKSPINA